MMKQGTLLGSFIVTSRKSNATEQSSNTESSGNDVKEAQLNHGSFKEAENVPVEEKKSNNAHDNEVQERKQRLMLTTTPEAAVKTPKTVGKISNGKLSLSGKNKCESLLAETPHENGTPTGTKSDAEAGVAYSDFLAQVSKETKSSVSETCNAKSSPVLQSNSEETGNKNEKSTMSYSDFLNLFKPAPVDVECSNEDLPDTDKMDNPLDNTKMMTPHKCKSILSFFSKSTSSKTQNTNRKSNSMTVIAEVHSTEKTVKTKSFPSPIKLRNQSQAKRMSDIDTIEYLGSEAVEEDESAKDVSANSKKRKNEPEANTTELLKKQKLGGDENDEDNNYSSSISTSKRSQSDNMKNHDQVFQMATEVSNKTSQSQLCFGKDGLALSKSKVKIKNEPVVAEEEDSVKEKKRGRPRKVSSGGLKEIGKPSPECSSEKEVVRGEENKTEAEDSEPEMKKLTSESTPLRRSSRIIRPVKPFTSLEIVKVDEDDDAAETEDEDKTKKVRKQDRKNQQVSKAIGTPKSKPNVPLAPIFMSKKVEEVQPPPEDPEKLRLRREFMMSGIPDELRRQIATNPVHVALEYPPFPRPSHVQQLCGETCDISSKPVSLAATNCKEETEVEEKAWEKLGWAGTIIPDSIITSKPFLHHTPLSESEQKKLIIRWQQVDAKFDFEKVFSRLTLQAKAGGTEDPSALERPEAPASNTSESAEEESDDIVIVDEPPSTAATVVETLTKGFSAPNSNACVWPDLHQPQSSKEMVGNSAVIEQLREWLDEWKKIVQKDIKKACKKSSQPSKTKGKGCWSDDSDFTDSEDEELQLCNTMLLTGPHGVGKTTSVYALAQEMGYKVFEVNSSTLRSGKQILSQLEEATQSHRVAPSKSRAQPPQDSPRTHAGAVKSEKPENLSQNRGKAKSVASAFAALFQTQGQQVGQNADVGKSKKREHAKRTSKGEPEKEAPITGPEKSKCKEKKMPLSKRRNCNADKEAGSPRISTSAVNKNGKTTKTATDEIKPCGASQNLATTSLILFDEVDVVFEEDKGFLATIEHFMASTKIPIILTSTTSSISFQLGARHDHIVFKRPPLISSVSFLSCVCLVYGVPMVRRSLEELLHLLDGDLRSCLLYLQFWCQSGGGSTCGDELTSLSVPVSSHAYREPEASNVWTNGCTINEVTSNAVGQDMTPLDACSDDSNGGQFLSLRPPARKARRIIEDDTDDESSNSSHQSVETGQHSLRLDEVHREAGTSSLLSKKRKKLSTRKTVDKATPLKACSDRMLDTQLSESTAQPSPSAENHDRIDIKMDTNNFVLEKANSGSGIKFHMGLAESFLGLRNMRLSSQSMNHFIQLLATNRTAWRAAVHEGAKSFEADRIDQIETKRVTRKLKQAQLPDPQYAIKCTSPTLSKAELDQALQVIDVIDRAKHCDSLYNLVLHCNSVPKRDRVKVQLCLPTSSSAPLQRKKRRRILEGSWLDSDCSDDDSEIKLPADEVEPKRRNNEVCDNKKEDKLHVAHSPSDTPDPSQMKIEGSGEYEGCKKTKTQAEILGESSGEKQLRISSVNSCTPEAEVEMSPEGRTRLAMLSNLSRYYESVSVLDTLETFYNKDCYEEVDLSPGMSDEDTSFASSAHCYGSSLTTELKGAVKLLSSRVLNRALDADVKSWPCSTKQSRQPGSSGTGPSSWPEELSLPIGMHAPDLWVLEKNTHKRSSDAAIKNVVNCLGMSMLTNDPVVHMDYLPYLRDICRSEKVRELAKIQRRFHHYFDNAGLALKKSTIACLTTTYTNGQSS